MGSPLPCTPTSSPPTPLKTTRAAPFVPASCFRYSLPANTFYSFGDLQVNRSPSHLPQPCSLSRLQLNQPYSLPLRPPHTSQNASHILHAPVARSHRRPAPGKNETSPLAAQFHRAAKLTTSAPRPPLPLLLPPSPAVFSARAALVSCTEARLLSTLQSLSPSVAPQPCN